MGQGDHVVSYSKTTINGDEFATFDISRIENGKIVEPWDNMETILPRSGWANTGKLFNNVQQGPSWNLTKIFQCRKTKELVVQ